MEDEEPGKKNHRAKRNRDLISESPKTKSLARSAAPPAAPQSTKKARHSPSIVSFPAVFRVYKEHSKRKTIFDAETLSSRACALWRSPSGGQQSAHHYQPAGVCRRLGVVQLELAMAEDIRKEGKISVKSKKRNTEYDNSHKQIYTLLKDKSKSREIERSGNTIVSGGPTKSEARKDVIYIYGEYYHRVNANVTQSSLIQQVQDDWVPIVNAGRVQPQWNQAGQYVDPSAPTSCRRLLKLLKDKKLKDLNAGRQTLLHHGLAHIPTDAVTVLQALVDLSTPNQALYDMPLLVSVPKIEDIEQYTAKPKKSRTVTVKVSIAIYANRLLFDVMTQNLQIVMASMERESVTILQGLSPPPSFPSADEEPVFASDPKGPKVTTETQQTDSPHEGEPANREFDDVGASDGTLDAFTHSGFLKLIENVGTNMDNFEAIEQLLGDKLQVDLMLHQKHALSFMYKMEHLRNGINSLIWEERSFPEGGRYWYSPVLGQLRLTLGHSKEPVRGGILADEMGLGKTCSVLALVAATLSKIKKQLIQEKRGSVTSATLIIVPPALLSQWVSEVFKVAGDSLVVDVFDHNSLEFQRRSKHSSENADADLVLTTYQSLEKVRKGGNNNALNILLSIHWARVVLDEMQEVRSHTTSIAKNCNALMANRRWMLSGTPLFEGFTDFRGELCFLRLDPFAADNEDGFFDFAITQHLENRSRYGLETLRVLSLLLLRRSKSMIVKKTNLPLLGLKPMTITFQPVPQDVSERAIYCFLEHLMHSVLIDGSGNQCSRRLLTKQKEQARAEKRSFLRILREVCASVHLLNGGLGCSSQIAILDRWMKKYNRMFIQDRQICDHSNMEEHFSCDEAIRFISQAEDKISTQIDFVSNLRMGHGGGVASRNRAIVDKIAEKIEERRDEMILKRFRGLMDRRKRAKARWHKALESITTGGLSDGEYATVTAYFANLWSARRTASFGHGWRPKLHKKDTNYLESIRRRLGFNWANTSALQISGIPNAVSKGDILASLIKCTGGDQERMQIFSAGPSETDSCWKALVLLGNSRHVAKIDECFRDDKKRKGLKIVTDADLPHIKDEAARAKKRFDLAESMAVIHLSQKNKTKEAQAEREWRIARLGLRAYGEYKEGHLLITKAFHGFRLKGGPRYSILHSLDNNIQTLNASIQAYEEEVDALSSEMESLHEKTTSKYSEKVQGLTAVEALQALQHGRSEETTCPVCQETIGENGGLVATTQCGHLSCSRCMEDWKKERQHQTLTCMECRKPVNRIITIDPTKKENEKAVEERKNDARQLVQKAAKLLKENGNGVLDPRLWQALYETMELPEHVDQTRDRHFPSIPGNLLAHVRTASNLPINSGSTVTNDRESIALSSKVRALLNDLPKDEHCVVFTSSKTFLKHLLIVLDLHDFGCRGLFTGQKEVDSKQAIDQWHNDKQVSVLVVQAGAAACGLTLTAACKLFIMEPFLKYEEEQQAYARLHRYGQKNAVSCIVYYTPISIESRLLEWRRHSTTSTPADEEVRFAAIMDSLNGGGEGDEDVDSDEEDYVQEDKATDENEESRNQTKFLLNLLS